MATLNTRSDEEEAHGQLRDTVMEMIGFALHIGKSIPYRLRSNPLQHSGLYLQLHFEPFDKENTNRLLKHLEMIRQEILHLIEDARISNPSIRFINALLRKYEERSERIFIRYVSAWLRNNIAALGIAPLFEHPYRERTDMLGGRLYHVEDIMRTIQQELPSKPDSSCAILTADAS